VLFNGCAPDAVQCSVQRCKVIYNQNAPLHCSNEWLLDDEHVTTPAIKKEQSSACKNPVDERCFVVSIFLCFTKKPDVRVNVAPKKYIWVGKWG